MEQQFCCHTTYDGALNDLRRLNTGVCRLTGNTFVELIHYFITGGDETCFMACELGSVTMIGSAGRNKQEKKTCDSRSSITVYRTGSVSGDTRLTMFLLQGIQRRAGFANKFLVSNGAAVGLTVFMTSNAFMTTDGLFS